jgi:diphthamide synthase subunit DPH2
MIINEIDMLKYRSVYIYVSHVDYSLQKEIRKARIKCVQVLFDQRRVGVLLSSKVEPILLD